ALAEERTGTPTMASVLYARHRSPSGSFPWARRRPAGVPPASASEARSSEPAGRWRAQGTTEPSAQIILVIILLIILF
ncbi:MAG: hypothetical protein QF437_19745, partial [Planctomycetota bacterium]|nr:hypothetical protein [Planctomycetota bacterium]